MGCAGHHPPRSWGQVSARHVSPEQSMALQHEGLNLELSHGLHPESLSLQLGDQSQTVGLIQEQRDLGQAEELVLEQRDQVLISYSGQSQRSPDK